MKKELLASPVIHSDETPVIVSKDGRDIMLKSHMWVYRTGTICGANSAVLYEHHPTRKTEVPRVFLKDFTGTLLFDGYLAYHSLGK